MRIRYGICFTLVLIFLSLAFVSGDGAKAVVEAVEEQILVYYNGNPVRLDTRPLVAKGSVYLPLQTLAGLFNKSMEWDTGTNSIQMGDRTDPLVAALREETAKKELRIKELEDQVKALESREEDAGGARLDALEEEINKAYGDYKDMSFQILLSGCDEEMRVRILIDLSLYQREWNRLSAGDRSDYLGNIHSAIAGRYPNAIMKGYFCNIKSPNRMLSFYNTPDGKIKTGSYKSYSTVSSMEDRINGAYDRYFGNMCLVYELSGNENRIDFNIHIPYVQYEAEWSKLSDYRIKTLLNKLAGEIESEFKGCHIYGNIYVMEGRLPLASCWKEPGKGLEFVREE